MLISLFVISGCGGDDSSLSQDEFSQQLELVCNKGLQEREKLVNSVTREFEEQQNRELTPEYEAENITKLVTLYQETIEEIKEIGLPEEEPEEVEAFIKTQEEASARVLASPLSARDNLDVIFEDADKAAESLDAHSCTL